MTVSQAELLEALVVASPDAVVVVDGSGRVELASPSIERLLGYDPAELVGSPVEVLLPEALRSVHEGHRHSFMGDPVPRRMGSGLALSARRADGSTLPVDISLVPVLVQGRPLVGAFIRDVTERRRNEELTGYVNDIASDLLSGRSTTETLTLTAERARTLAEAAAAWVMVPAGADQFEVAAGDGKGTDSLVGAHLEAPGSLSARALAERSVIAVASMADDPAVLPEARRLGFGPGLYLPLSDDETIGVLVVARPPGAPAFEPSLTASMEVFASAAAIVLSLGAARSELDKMREIAEHERIARDLHDTVIQRLFAVGMTLQALQPLVNGAVADRLGDAVDAVDYVIREIRETIFSLGHPRSSGPDIRQQLRQVVAEAAGQLGFQPRVGFRGPVEAAISQEVSDHLLAVAREALSNIVRHAKASRVEVVLEADAGALTLNVSDDGIGLAGAPSAGHGLENMHSRAHLLGGELEVSAGPLVGTLVRWRVPLEQGAEA
ncbi:MAG TPA: hypothetical protein DCQ30_16720 [Acidimicrobiaceae bacterium]|nr:hypothetical protein [Acidimicrobiaceae bacterium]